MMSQAIRTLLVEDDEVFRIGLNVALRQSADIKLLGSCADGESAMRAVLELQPDLILMDLSLPFKDGIEATREIKALHPAIKILALTSHAEFDFISRAVQSGVDGFCLKGLSTDRLVAVIQQVHQGTFLIDAPVAGLFKQQYFQQTANPASAEPTDLPAESNMDLLTDREREVLSLLMEGRKNPQIAELLSISPGTVRVHVHSILHKLQVKDRMQAVLLAKRLQRPDF